MNSDPIRAAYEIIDYGPDGVVVIIADGIPQAAPTWADGLRFLVSEGVEIHPEHVSIAAALGVTR